MLVRNPEQPEGFCIFIRCMNEACNITAMSQTPMILNISSFLSLSVADSADVLFLYVCSLNITILCYEYWYLNSLLSLIFHIPTMQRVGNSFLVLYKDLQ